MTRIFDALKKAELLRQATGHATQAPPPHPAGARTSASPRELPEPGRWAYPLLEGPELSLEVMKEMKSLRVGLEATLRDRSPRIVMFLGPQGGEGTSTVVLQFAQALASDPSTRPLIVDTNAERPAYELDAVHQRVVLDPKLRAGSTSGLSAVAPNLHVAPVSDDIRRAGLFPAATLRALFEATSPAFDWILVDGAPILESPDSPVLGALADGVVLVLQAGRTKRPVLNRASALLANSGASVLGSVLNRRVLEIPEFIYRRI